MVRLLQLHSAWAEDRATRGRDPSADPGAKTEAGGVQVDAWHRLALSFASPLRDWHERDKSKGVAIIELNSWRSCVKYK